MPLSVFTEEIKNIWSEIKTIRGKLAEPHQPKENEKERNGNQEIYTLQQKNQDLQNEICMLKDQLKEQNNVLKNISEERVSYRTATIEDMEDFVKPLLRKKPDNVILHTGTNDLNTQEPRLTAEGIVNLALQIEGDAPETNLAISGLIARADDKDGKVSRVNKILKKFCRQNHWNFIEHNNINQTHLNRGGLRLFKSGSALVTQKFCKHID